MKVMHIGKARWQSVVTVAKITGVMPVHKHTGCIAPNAVVDEDRTKVLKEHFEYLLQLGEV
jgi:hypothetical protein